MKAAAILISLLIALPASAGDSYYRFWRRTKRADLSPKEFVDRLNSDFVPRTVQVAAGFLTTETFNQLSDSDWTEPN